MMWGGAEESDSNDTVIDFENSNCCTPVSVEEIPSGTNICGPVCVLGRPHNKQKTLHSTDSLLESEKANYERRRHTKSKEYVRFEQCECVATDPFIQAVDEAAVAAVIIARAREARRKAKKALEYANKACSAANASIDVAEYVAKCARVTAHVALDICNHDTFEEAFRQTNRHSMTWEDFKEVMEFRGKGSESSIDYSGSGSDEELKNIVLSSGSTIHAKYSTGHGSRTCSGHSVLSGGSNHKHLGSNVSQKVRLWEDKATATSFSHLSTKVQRDESHRSHTTTDGSSTDSRRRSAEYDDKLPTRMSVNKNTDCKLPIVAEQPKNKNLDNGLYDRRKTEDTGMKSLAFEDFASSSDSDSADTLSKTLKPKRSKQMQRVSKTEAAPILEICPRRRRRESSGSCPSDGGSPERPVSPLVHGADHLRLDMQLLPSSHPQAFHPGMLRSNKINEGEEDV